MKTLELFPECPPQDQPHEPPCHADSRCSLCYSAEFIADAEAFGESYDDQKSDEDPPYWLWDDNDYAQDVCVKRKGEL